MVKRHQRAGMDAAGRLLRLHGLPPTSDGAALLPALGGLIKDHAHFRDLLMVCAPEQRGNMYESLRCNLNFRPHPLDVYVSEAGRIAEGKQLPTQDPEGNMHAYQAPEIGEPATEKPDQASLDILTAQRAVDAAVPREHLMLTCRKCTRVAYFEGWNKALAIHAAREAGWTWDEVKGDGVEVCPLCP
jgi:hypothetical protein